MPGSATLIGGDPGIGKSTLLLQVAATLRPKRARCCLCERRGSAADQVRPARKAAGPGRRAGATRERDIGARHPDDAWRWAGAGIAHHRSRSRRCTLDLIEGAPGTVSQVRALGTGADPLRQAGQHRACAGRPRHQGRQHRRTRACSSIWSTRCSASRVSAATNIGSARASRTASAGPTRSASSPWRRKAIEAADSLRLDL